MSPILYCLFQVFKFIFENGRFLMPDASKYFWQENGVRLTATIGSYQMLMWHADSWVSLELIWPSMGLHMFLPQSFLGTQWTFNG